MMHSVLLRRPITYVLRIIAAMPDSGRSPVQRFELRFRGEHWWIVRDDTWHTAYRELETAKSLAIAIARRTAELGIPSLVIVHHEDGTEEVVWDGTQE